jgi:hypothetical protein
MKAIENRPERGSATLELVLIAPALLALALVVAIASSVSGARGDVDDAAWEAARAASLSRSTGEARAAAEHAVTDRLGGGHWPCLDRTLTLDGPRFVPGGAAAVTLTCRLRLADRLPLLPGAITIRAHSDEPLERYRGMR